MSVCNCNLYCELCLWNCTIKLTRTIKTCSISFKCLQFAPTRNRNEVEAYTFYLFIQGDFNLALKVYFELVYAAYIRKYLTTFCASKFHGLRRECTVSYLQNSSGNVENLQAVLMGIL